MSLDPNLAQCEEEAARLLPWFVAGSLAASDAERVARHLELCSICRADAEHERQVRALLKSDARIEYAPQPGLSRTLERIDALEQGTAVVPQRRRRHGATRWLAAAVVLQAIGLGLFTAHFYPQRAAARASYGTLSMARPVPSALELRAVFAPDMTLEALHTLLAAEKLTIVSGPGESGAYTLASTTPGITREGLAAVIAALRREPRALFVEPVYDGGSVRP
jgi:anti-sigma factor (TIGR02949 family)